MKIRRTASLCTGFAAAASVAAASAAAGCAAAPPYDPPPRALACDPAEGPLPEPLPLELPPIRPPPSPLDEGEEPMLVGQMTERAAEGKRLFDHERWAAALIVLSEVADGTTGDDKGNRQIAEYHLGIARYRLGHYELAFERFEPIWANPAHVKHVEGSLWLMKLATHASLASRAIDQMGHYSIPRFSDRPGCRIPDSRMDEDYCYWLSFIYGRYAFRRGAYDKAIELMARIPPESYHGGHAGDCIRLARSYQARQTTRP